MKRFSTLVLASGLLFLSSVVASNHVSAQTISAVPIDVEVPLAPTPVKADGRIHLLYELHLTNLRLRSLELIRLEVLNDQASVRPLAVYRDAELVSRLARPGAPSDLADKRAIGGGMRAVVFLQITFNSVSEVPLALRHRLFFKSDDPNGEERLVDTARVVVQRKPPLVIGPPVHGGGWLASNGMSNTSSHRRTLLAVNGKARIAQRFATDWTRIGADGLAFRGDPSKNANWSAYGMEVLAVADASVADVSDGMPENDPTSANRAVPITLENAAGNYVILDLGHGNFALYAHLQPGRIHVKIGDKVKRGQVLALLGNSGNSDAPHLHFHMTDGNSPLGAEGVPYVIDSFELQGILPSKGLLIEGGWKPSPRTKPDKRLLELPIENAVVRFPFSLKRRSHTR
jgi:murein DD-endopeptidase MepM/ murein hydrolase activator NlpD